MVFDATRDKDSNSSKFTFASAMKGPDNAEYLETFTASVPADATNIDLSVGEGAYQLASGTAAPVVVASCSNAVDGLIFTLLGSGGTHPSTIEASPFMLKNGTNRTALAGSKITFKAFKDGANSFKYFEVSRS